LAWRHGTGRDLDAFLLGRLPDYEYHPARELVAAGLVEPCYRGPARYREALSSWFEAWGDDARIEPVEVIDLGDRVVVLAHMPTRGRASGIPLSQDYAWLFTLRNGKVTHQQEYLDHAEALEAVGLRE
jgi:ketosteroid isomerase-like protein